MLLKGIADVEQGRDPTNVVRDPEGNRFKIISTYGFLPEGTSWKKYHQGLEGESRG